MKDPTELEVGRRTYWAWLVETGSDRSFFIDGQGKVLRVDIDPHPVHFGERWIRLMSASEY